MPTVIIVKDVEGFTHYVVTNKITDYKLISNRYEGIKLIIYQVDDAIIRVNADSSAAVLAMLSRVAVDCTHIYPEEVKA